MQICGIPLPICFLLDSCSEKQHWQNVLLMLIFLFVFLILGGYMGSQDEQLVLPQLVEIAISLSLAS